MKKQVSIFLVLVTLMASFYMVTFRGRIESGDTLRALDVLTSQVRYHDWFMDESIWFKYEFRVRNRNPEPLSLYDVEEKLNIYLAEPLLHLAQNIQQLGNIHTVWLFNIIITSLNVGIVYLLVCALGYSDRVGVITALTAAIATNMWAYSQTFFREPLVSFFLLLSLLMLAFTRHKHFLWRIVGVTLAGLCVIGSYLTKFSGVMAIPAIIIFALPFTRLQNNRTVRRLSILLLILQIIGLGVLLLFDPFPVILQQLVSRFNEVPELISYALRVYILSPGASLWGTSPVLLLAIIGCLIWIRQHQHQRVWMIWLLFVGYTVGHALVTGAYWFGGQSWPPRFLVPIIPVLMVAMAPVIERIIDNRHKALTAIWLSLLLYGMWIQFTSVSLMWYQYEASLPPESAGLTEWEPGLTQLEYFRWVVLSQRWNDLGIDFLWVRANVPMWGIQFVSYTIIVFLLLVWLLRQNVNHLIRYLSPIGAILVWCILTITNLQSVYYLDPVTQSQKVALHEALNYLVTEAEEDDYLILPNNTYNRFILNHLDTDHPRPIILPAELAEPASEKQSALVVSNNPNDWLPLSSLRVIHHTATWHDHLWYLANTNPFMAWSFRPFERYMALFYYPLQEVALEHPDDTVRLLEYSIKYPAPNPFSTFTADDPTNLKYGEHIDLVGFQLPGGVNYSGGDSVELSLMWQTDAPLPQDYTVAWFIAKADSNEVLVQGQDAMPQAGFAPTSRWSPNSPIWDNRALRLPEQIESGEYVIWVLLYYYNNETAQLERLPVTGSSTTDQSTIGILPVTLMIE